MRALVTGGTGFVGSHLVRHLNEAGHQVRVLHRSSSNLQALAGQAYESALGDVTDAEALHTACQGCDWVFHVAAVADYWRADVSHMFEVNVAGTRKVLAAAQATGVQRVIFTSSAAAIGLHESALADESLPFNLPPHQFQYGYSKSLAEEAVAEAVAAGQDVVTLNPSVIMGPGDLNMISGNFILQMRRYRWLTPITRGGLGVIDVRDVAAAHVAAAERGIRGERYILNAANYSYREWFNMIADVLGVARPRLVAPNAVLPLAAASIRLMRRLGLNTPVDADQVQLGGRRLFFDASKAHATLGLPQIAMRQSLEDTYNWYLAHGYLR